MGELTESPLLNSDSQSAPPEEVPQDPTADPVENGSTTVSPELPTNYNENAGNEKEEKEDKGLGALENTDTTEGISGSPGSPSAEVPLPPPEAARGAPLFSEAAFAEPGPISSAPPREAVLTSQNLPAEEDMLHLLISDSHVRNIWKRAEQAQININDRIDNLTIARTLLDQLQCARNEILAGRDHYEEAERALDEVEYRIQLSERVAKWSYSIGSWLAVYEIIWFVAAILGMLFVSPWLLTFVQAYSGGPASPAWPSQLWAQDLVFTFNSMMWGVLGGVTGAIYALWIHIAREQDFDRQFSMWYLLSPVGGFIVGAFIFLVVRLGVFSLTSGTSAAITSPLIIYALAWLSGYQQNVVYDLVKRLLQMFKVEASTDTSQK